MTPGVPRLVERFPSERVIRWNPLPDSYHLLAEMIRGPEDEYKVVVAQAALRQIDAHLRDAASATAVGFLLGQLYECPETGLHYTLVRGAERVPEAYVQVEDGALTEETWRALDPELRRHGAHVVGWYRSRPRVTAQMPPLDAQAHITRFRQPWQAALLVSPDVERPSGAFFQYEARLGRVYAVPFHELLDSHPVHGTAGQRTWVRWVNYVTDTDLGLLMDQTRRLAEEARNERAQAGRLLQPLRDALDDAWAWVRTQRRPEATTPPVTPAHGVTRPGPRAAPPVHHAPPSPAAPPAPPRIVPRTPEGQRTVPLRPAAHGADSRGVAPAGPRLTTPGSVPATPLAPAASAPTQPIAAQAPRSPVGGTPIMGAGAAQAAARMPEPQAPPAPAPEPQPERAAWNEPGPAYTWAPLPRPSGGQPAATGDGLYDDASAEPIPHHDLSAPLAVVLPPGFYRPSPQAPGRRTGRVVGALGVVAIAAAAGYLYLGDRTAPSTRPAPKPAQQATAPASPTGGPTTLERAAAATVSDPAAITRFDERAAGLGMALGAFRARLQGQPATADCPAVAAAHAVVSHGFDSLSVAMRAAAGALDVERSMRYNKLGADVGELNREYLRTRCARSATAPTP